MFRGFMEFDSALIAIERAKTLSALSNTLADLRDQTGVAHLVYHAVHIPIHRKPNPVLLLTYDDAWVRRYTAEDYFRVDPVVIAGRKGFLPIDWMTVDHDSAAARYVFSEAESHGVGRHGFTLPIRGPFGERALFTITSNESHHHWHRWRYTHLNEFHLIACYLHDCAMQLAGFRLEPALRALSRREHQCLQFLASGRTPQQMADTLKVSSGAVHFTLRSARKKLNCATIEEAVIKAGTFELVQYGELAEN